ncbi:BlaI/MecI/CopY family transcriptional regulator [Austwickia chelonae]|nr:BlaI/MecI/CopY family transcriptional regulator [Austwickia chelonae]
MPRQRPEGATGLNAHFGEREFDVMDVLWSATDRLDVGEVCERLDGKIAYATVKTIMERLVIKGHLCREKTQRRYLYWPSRTKEETESEHAAADVRDLMDGFGHLAVVSFVDAIRSDEETLDHVRRLLAQVEDRGDESTPRKSAT